MTTSEHGNDFIEAQRRPGEHRDPVAPQPLTGARPTAGPIAVLPHDNDSYSAAITAGGGTVAPLGDDTRGLVWLNLDGAALGRVLASHPSIEWVQLPMAGDLTIVVPTGQLNDFSTTS